MTPYRKFSTTVKKQRLLASKKDCCGLHGGRKPHLDFKIAGGMRTRGARAWEAVEKTGQNIFNSLVKAAAGHGRLSA